VKIGYTFDHELGSSANEGFQHQQAYQDRSRVSLTKLEQIG